MTTTKIDHQNGVLRICVDRLEGNRAGGRVFSQRLTAPMSFSDLGGLLLQLEATGHKGRLFVFSDLKTGWTFAP